MSKIGDLINKLCPNGVEYKSIGACCKIETGKLNANAAVENGEYMFFTTAKEPSKTNTYRWDEEALLIAGNANIGDVKHYKGKFNAYQRTYVLTNFSKDINVKYLYFSLSNNLKVYLDKHKNEAAMTYIVLSTLKNFKVAVPPLEVQDEIVRILDDFTLLSAELSAELKARQQQYEYYRNTLVNNEKNKYLSEISKIKNGKDYKSFDEGNIPVYGTGGIMTYTSRFAYDKPSVLIPRKGSINKLYYVEEPFWNVDTIFYTEINKEVAIPKYVFYCLENEHLEELNTAGGVPSLTQAVLNKVKLHIPSLDKQKEVVNKLDKLYNLINNIFKGLPAEIEARQKQYEYYRDKLLTFKELEIKEG